MVIDGKSRWLAFRFSCARLSDFRFQKYKNMGNLTVWITVVYSWVICHFKLN